jgi:hypothetical protein
MVLTCTHAIEIHGLVKEVRAIPVEVGSHHERLELLLLVLILSA